MKELTAASGFVLAENENTVVLLDRQTRAAMYLLFPLVIMTLNLGLAGVAFSAMTLTGAASFPLALCAGLFAAGVLLGLASWAGWKNYRRSADRPLHDLPRIATWDFDRNEFRDASDAVVGPLSHVRVHKTVRLGSQGWWLVAKCGTRQVILVKGVNIMGGVGGFVEHLKGRGLMN